MKIKGSYREVKGKSKGYSFRPFNFLLTSVHPFNFLLTSVLVLLTSLSCGAGDDDGRRLGDVIVGTWQRGWGDDDVIIEGDVDVKPHELSYDKFIFLGDGSYNGMLRKGSFSAWSFNGSLIYEGTYQCDNNNLKLEFQDAEGVDRKILAQVMSFTDDTIWLNYENEQHHVTVTFVIRKGYSSSSSISE